MIASNSLGSYGYDASDLTEIDNAVKNNDLSYCNILVYYVTYSSAPTLFRVVNKDGIAIHETLKTYSKDIKSTTIERMSEVCNDIKTICPADDYGLVLWSHATGWALSLSNNSLAKKLSSPQYRSFGDDSSKQMQLDELANAIPDDLFSFIYVDACYMGGIEEAYQLRNKTKYYIASSALLPAAGMPYDKNIPCFCEDTPNLIQACKNTYNYYNSLSGTAKTLTISLVDCSQLEKLAQACKYIYANSAELQDVSDIQGYIPEYEGKCIYFDLEHYIKTRAKSLSTTDFDTALSSAVVYKATTGNIFNRLEIKNFSGLSTYILGQSGSSNENYYKTLDWYNAIN
ncbi:MAG: clostripain-related cysteine peptidase [Muribaculaceae bacterium]|nr:clostripain-related cysteine peptidase [Muribaculaceae bacterium]